MVNTNYILNVIDHITFFILMRSSLRGFPTVQRSAHADSFLAYFYNPDLNLNPKPSQSDCGNHVTCFSALLGLTEPGGARCPA